MTRRERLTDIYARMVLLELDADTETAARLRRAA